MRFKENTLNTPTLAAVAVMLSFGISGCWPHGDRPVIPPHGDPGRSPEIVGPVVELDSSPGVAIYGIDPCNDELPSARSMAHHQGASVMAGPYKVSAEGAAEYGTTPEDFGQTRVIAVPDKLEFDVQDMRYPLPDGSFGVRVIPTADNRISTDDDGNVTEVEAGSLKLADGSEVPGYQIMDGMLREASGLGASDPVYALAGFTHYEYNKGTIKELGTEKVKTEMSVTHLAAYIGKGETTNSPDDYHDSRWDNSGYPANVYLVKSDMDGDGDMDADDQRVLNNNAHTVLGILGHGVQFPGDYKNDPLTHARSLEASLEYYKRWLEKPCTADDECEDPFFLERVNALYCAELQTLSLNIALNLPHNEAAFVEAYGEDGKSLFQLAKQRYQEKRPGGGPVGASPKELVETDFVPLYERTAGFEVPAGTAVIDAEDAAVIGNALAWKPQTTADIMATYIETYASFPDVGGPISAATLLGFKDLIQQRTGVSSADYMALAMPVMQKIMVADAVTKDIGSPDALAQYSQTAAGTLYVAAGGKEEDLRAGTPDPLKMGVVQRMMKGVEENGAGIIACHGLDKLKAHRFLRAAIAKDLEAAGGLQVIQSGAATYFSPPAITQRIALGQWGSHPEVDIVPVGTAMDSSEVDM